MGAWCVTSGVSFMQNVNDGLHFTGILPHFYYRIARTTDPISENRPKKLVKRQEWGAISDFELFLESSGYRTEWGANTFD